MARHLRPTKCVVVVPTSELQKSIRFYRDGLGLELVEEGEDLGTGAILALGDAAELELIELEDVRDVPEPRSGIGVQVQPSEVDAVYVRLVELGFSVKRPPEVRPWGMRGFGALDPNGIPVNVYAPAPADEASPS